jgi:hypothetical protein
MDRAGSVYCYAAGGGCCRGGVAMIDIYKLYELTRDRHEALATVASAMQGHMLNALFELDGGTKAGAREILKRGLALLDEHYAPIRAEMEKQRAGHNKEN